MYRFLFSPRWLGFHLLVIVGIVTMVNLGFWQLRRLDERKAFNAQVSERIADPPAPLDDVLTAGADPDSVEWRSVTARGTYLPDEQFLVVNRSQDGIGGTMVVTPMQLADGRVLLVERGFMPGTTASRRPRRPARSTSSVGCARRRSVAPDSSATPRRASCRRRSALDIARLAPQLPGPPVPMFIELTASRPAEPTPFPAPVTLPELTDGPHLSYAVQWFTFSVAVVVGWVLAVRKSLKDQAPRRVHHQPPPQRPRQSPQHRRHRPGDLARRGVDAQVRRPHVDRQVEEGVEERRQLVLVEAQQHLEPVGVQPARPAQVARPDGVVDQAGIGARRRRDTARAMAVATARCGAQRGGDGVPGGGMGVAGGGAEPGHRTPPRAATTRRRRS